MARALIISSDEGTRYLYELAISYQKITVDVASDIVTGLEKIGKIKPDIVILDIMVPDIKNLEALKKLKGKVDSMPLIIMTDMKDAGKLNEASIFGAVKTMVKNENSIGDLIKTVRKAVKK